MLMLLVLRWLQFSHLKLTFFFLRSICIKTGMGNDHVSSMSVVLPLLIGIEQTLD